MFFKGKHLRIITPKTTNGQIPLIIDGVPQYSTTFAPLSAKATLERKNAKLAKTGYRHLMAKIEEVTDEPETAAPVKESKKLPKATPPAENKITPPQDMSAVLAQTDGGGIKL